jgi:Ribbon-helix-helix protein, copG family
MATVSIELNDEQARRLRELAAAAQRSEQDLCREALQQYLEGHLGSDGVTAPFGYAALRAMIGLVKDGPTSLSVEHDFKPGEEPRPSSSTRAAGSPSSSSRISTTWLERSTSRL